MKPLYLKFVDKQTAHNILTLNGFVFDGNGVLTGETCKIYEVGVIKGDIVYDDNFNIVSQEPDKQGYHVNLLVPLNYNSSLLEYEIQVMTPNVKWAGY